MPVTPRQLIVAVRENNEEEYDFQETDLRPQPERHEAGQQGTTTTEAAEARSTREAEESA